MDELQSGEQNDILLYQADDGKTWLEVHLDHETVWLSLSQMAVLFQRDKSVVSWHLRNVFQTGELMQSAVRAKNATTAADGKVYLGAIQPGKEYCRAEILVATGICRI